MTLKPTGHGKIISQPLFYHSQHFTAVLAHISVVSGTPQARQRSLRTEHVRGDGC